MNENLRLVLRLHKDGHLNEDEAISLIHGLMIKEEKRLDYYDSIDYNSNQLNYTVSPSSSNIVTSTGSVASNSITTPSLYASTALKDPLKRKVLKNKLRLD